MKILIAGAGMRARACAFDLLRNPAVSEVTLVDVCARSLADAKRFLRSFKVRVIRADAGDLARVKKLLAGYDAMVSCVPFFFNYPLAKAAISAKVHFVDLGGNTEIALKELALHESAKRAGVTIIPDVGLGPGMTTTLAVHAMQQLDETREVRIRFAEHGPINEYVGQATALRHGKRVLLPGLSEIEPIEVPGLGRMEAAHAAGGLSTLAYTYEGKVKTMDCKLIRYPGQCAAVAAMNAMGFFSQRKRKLGAAALAPRDLSAALFREHFSRASAKDMVVIQSTARGLKDGRRAEVAHQMRDHYDERHQMTAMTRTTGFSASIVVQMLLDRTISRPGAYPVETGVPTGAFIDQARRRGFHVTWKLSYRDVLRPLQLNSGQPLLV